jgi:putative aldouronate transport system substrate-binding protein
MNTPLPGSNFLEVQEVMKKVFYLAVAVLMLIVPMFGCSTAAPAATTAPVQSASATVAAAATSSAVPAAQDGPYAKYDPEITVNFALCAGLDPKFPAGQDYKSNIWLTEYKTDLGINAKYIWEAAGLEQYETKLNMHIASNELPDIIYCTNQGQMQSLVDAGYVQDLTDLFDKYMSPLSKQGFQIDNGAALKQTSIEGKLWALPRGPVVMNNLEYTYIRQDWMDNLGLSAPKTTEDLMAIMEAFAKNDPDKNSKADTYGLVISNEVYENYMEIRGFANSFGAYPTSWILKDGKLAYGSVQPEMKTALAALAKLYADGCIDKEFVAKKAIDSSSDAVAGKGGVCFGQFWLITWPLPDTNKNNGDNSMKFWKPYPILDTATPTTLHGTMGQQRVTDMYMVRKGFEHPEALFKLYNHYEDRLYGDKYNKDKYHSEASTGNSIFMLSPVITTGAGNVNVAQNLAVTKAIDTKDESVLVTPEQQGTYKTVKEYVDGNHDSNHKTQSLMFYGADSTFGMENAAVTAKNFTVDQFYGADTPEMQRRMSVLRGQEQQMILDIITGNKPVDYFDEWAKSWFNLGGETITFEVNQWYDKVK